MSTWSTTRYQIDLRRPQIMGIVNVTPDSFSDGGCHAQAHEALLYCERLIQDGVDILDIGGESTRPGAPVLTVDDEWARLEAVLKGAVTLGVPVSVDTSKAEVMRRALGLGVDIINDVHAFESEGALHAIAAHPACGVCLMHMRGEPATMQQQTQYSDVVEQVRAYLDERAGLLRQRGVAADRITLDPGIGFGKTPAHNIQLLRDQACLLHMGYPLLIGWSRKSTLGHITGRAVDERLVASVAAALAGIQLGARIVRVHDVAATADALKVWQAAGLVA
jgi:dihydropteroate synthase